jgi:phosphomannomutase
MKKIVMFDMDGTLTPARESMGIEILECLKRLERSGYEIGIVSGSDLDYIESQCRIMFSDSIGKRVHLLPCNGTKYYRLGEGLAAKSEISMTDELGQAGYNRLVETCLRGQLEIMGNSNELPLTGNFFQYRGSLLNWCPIGRAAKKEHRAIWERLDEGNRIRMPWLGRMREEFVKSGIGGLMIALGGETSFDIYPNGWDKTYAMKHFKGYKIYFIGDRCRENGNDHAIYEACRPNSWSTTGPEQTIEYIEQLINGVSE